MRDAPPPVEGRVDTPHTCLDTKNAFLTKSNKPLDMSLCMRMTPLAIRLSSTDTGSVYYRLSTTPCTPTGLLERLAHKNLDCFVRLIARLTIRLTLVCFHEHISTTHQ